MVDPGKFVDSVFAAENIVNKVLPLSTLYAFRTRGSYIVAHAMFIFSPLDEHTDPVSTAHYLLHDGTVISVVSLCVDALRNLDLSITESYDVVFVLDFYYPPCVCTLRALLPLSRVIEQKFGQEFLQSVPGNARVSISRSMIYVDKEPTRTAYIVEQSPLIDSAVIARTCILLALMKLSLEGRIATERVLELLSATEKIITERAESR